jgi:hypothetical protein
LQERIRFLSEELSSLRENSGADGGEGESESFANAVFFSATEHKSPQLICRATTLVTIPAPGEQGMSLASEMDGLQVTSKLEEDMKAAQAKAEQLSADMAAAAKEHARVKATLSSSLASAE